MPIRQFTDKELVRLKRLSAEAIDVVLIHLTRTGLNKSIMDATASVRSYLKEKKLHDYETQGRGASANGVKLNAILLREDVLIETQASLYKPEAKPNGDGDPRIWFYGLRQYAEPDDMLAIIAHNDGLAVLNITKIDVVYVLDHKKNGPVWDVLHDISANARSVSDELLEKLRLIATKGFVQSVMDARADTAVGRTLEAALGIEMNSRRQPDYKGIEIKAYRRQPTSRENRKQLFAKVPNWEISKFSGMADVLDAFGYFRNGRDRLNCTVSASNVNSQGLTFSLNEKAGILNEVSNNPKYGAFASWYLSELRDSLARKHSETFWVAAKVHPIDGREHFEFTDIIHTRNPILSQFDILIEQGVITMDHMIKRTSSGGAQERGPSFKIESRSLELLFPPSRTYALA